MNYMAYIYKLTNKVNGKLYIGQTVRTYKARWKAHLTAARNGSDKYLHTAIRHYGEGEFEMEVLEELPREMLNEREQHFIALYRCADKKYGYNLTAGGNQWKKTPEQRAAASMWMMGNKHGLGHKLTEEHKQRIGAAARSRPGSMLGKKFSKEHKAKIGLASKRRAQDPDFIEHMRSVGLANRGRKRTEEQKSRLGDSHIGSRRSEETKQRMSEARKAWWANKNARQLYDCKLSSKLSVQ